MNVVDAIARQAQAHPKRVALLGEGRSVAFRQFWNAGAALAHNLAQLGVRQGDSIALQHLGNEAHLMALVGIARLGAISTAFPATLPPTGVRTLVERHRIKFVLHGPVEPQVPDGVTLIRGAAAFQRLPAGAVVPPVVHGLADEVWHIALSSGTTGKPKSIPITHGERELLQRLSLDAYPGGPGDRLLVYAEGGLSFGTAHALTQLAGGGTLVLTRGPSPQHCEDLLRTTRPTRLLTTTGTAFILANHFKTRPGGAAQWGLLSLLLAGSAAPPALLRTLEEHLCPNIHVTYGSTEFGTVARSDFASRLARPESAGRVMPWVQAQAVDEHGQPLAPGTAGLLRFRIHGRPMKGRYLDDEEATARAYRDGWFQPGDTGSVDEEGFLTLGEREDDRLNLDGIKIDVTHIERELAAEPGVLEVAAVPVPTEQGRQRLVAAVVADGQPDMERLGRKLQAMAGATAAVAVVPQLPKNEAGKVMRKELSAWLKGRLGPKSALKSNKEGSS